MNKFYWIIALLVFLACGKEPSLLPEEQDCSTTGLCATEPKVVWQTLLNEDASGCFSKAPILFEKEVFYTRSWCNQEGVLVSKDAFVGGETLWSWNKFPTNGFLDDITEQLIDGHILVLLNDDKLYGIDLATHAQIWEAQSTDGTCGGQIISQFGKWVFHVRWTPDKQESKMLRIDGETGAVDTLFSLQKEADHPLGLMPGTGWINPLGDTLLIFQNRQIDWSSNQGKIDLYAYNINKQVFDWKVENITATGFSSYFEPIVREGKVFFQGETETICFDALTGAVIWRRNFEEKKHRNTAHLLVNEKLIVHCDEGYLYALSIETGSVIWENSHSQDDVENIVYYDGMIYLGHVVIESFDIDSGKLAAQYFTPNADLLPANAIPYFSQKLTVNEELGYLYTTDQYFIMCIDLNH